jgi:RES domain
MPEFDSWQSYWSFKWSVQSHARYIFTAETNEFLELVKATCKSRSGQIPAGTIFWRAQRGYEWVKFKRSYEGEEFEEEEMRPFPRERMKPMRGAKEGRANPKGIPCLYLATDEKTAMAETRPWIGSYISVGQFKTLKELTLINLSVHSKNTIYLKEPDAAKKESAVWADIDRSFSEPITNGEQSADYAPTQILSELFRNQGFDGVIYKSKCLLGDGLNVALFDLDVAELINCFLYEVKSVSFGFERLLY